VQATGTIMRARAGRQRRERVRRGPKGTVENQARGKKSGKGRGDGI
jgi:hypothetical protein